MQVPLELLVLVGVLQRAAQSVGRLEQRDLVAPLGRGDGGGHAAGAAAGDPDGLDGLSLGLHVLEVDLVAGEGVHVAAELVGGMHLGQAVGAAQALVDLIELARADLLGPVGVGNEGAAHGHGVRLAGGNDLLRHFGGVDAADGGDGDLDAGLLHRLGVLDVAAVGQVGVGMGDDGLRHTVEARGDVDHVDLVLHHLDEGDALVGGQAVLLHLVAADAVVDEEVGAAGLPDGVDDHDREAGAVLEAAAETVGAVVIRRGQELAQQPAVSAVEDAHVPAGLLQDRRAVGVALDGMGDHVLVHLQHGGAVRPDKAVRTPRGAAVRVAAGIPGVVQLEVGYGTVLLDGVGHLGQHVHVFLDELDVAGDALTVDLVNGSVAHGDHGAAALGLLREIADHLLAGRTVPIGVAQHIGRGKDTVAEDDVLHPQRLKQMRILIHNFSFSLQGVMLSRARRWKPTPHRTGPGRWSPARCRRNDTSSRS